MNNASVQNFSSHGAHVQHQGYSEASMDATMAEISEKARSQIIERIRMEMAKEAADRREGKEAAPLLASTGTYVKVPYVKTPYVKVPYVKTPYVKI